MMSGFVILVAITSMADVSGGQSGTVVRGNLVQDNGGGLENDDIGGSKLT
jgi:hypothetical protein